MTLRLLLASAVALGVGAPAASALSISGTSVKTLPEPAGAKPGAAVVANGLTTDVIYYLDLHAGPTDQRFNISLTPGQFATAGKFFEGASVDGPMQFTLYGPGEIGVTNSGSGVLAACSERERFHGYAPGTGSADVFLPAGADTIFAVRYSMGRLAPWADTDLRLGFKFNARIAPGYPAGSVFAGGPATSVDGIKTTGRTVPVPVVGGKGKAARIGAHLILETTPAGRWGQFEGKPRAIKRTGSVRVRGRLVPAIAGEQVKLQWSRSGGRGLRTAATVRTGKQGRFTATLRPPGTGVRELWADYPSQPGALRPDGTSCPLVYRVS